MPQLTASQIRDYAYAAGFRGEDLQIAVAVALAESGGDTRAYNPELASSYSRPGAGSRGLWQIFGAVHPNYNSSAAFDPAVNARGAYEIYKAAGSKFTPWSAYKGGQYKKFLGAVPTGEASAIPQGAVGIPIGGGVQLKPQYQEGGLLPSSVTVELPKIDWLSIGLLAAGMALVILGIIFLFAKSEPGQRVIALGGEAAKLAAIGAL